MNQRLKHKSQRAKAPKGKQNISQPQGGKDF